MRNTLNHRCRKNLDLEVISINLDGVVSSFRDKFVYLNNRSPAQHHTLGLQQPPHMRRSNRLHQGPSGPSSQGENKLILTYGAKLGLQQVLVQSGSEATDSGGGELVLVVERGVN